jgi:PelA/Pel-15E family pectate lyase
MGLAMNCDVRPGFSLLIALIFAASIVPRTLHAIRWERAQREDAEWFGSDEGKQVVANVLAMQLPCGGWDKNLERTMDLGKPLSDTDRQKLGRREDRATIDNGATYTQLRFLARAYSAAGDPAVRDAFLKGIDYLLSAQYDNGGWPMYYPLRKGYYTHIHFNDNSVAGVMNLMRDIADGEAPFDFVDAGRRERAAAAVTKGIDCILKCQVVVDGKRTVWCAQHDEVTLKPTAARAYEPVSLSGQESVELVRCLMRVDRPSPEIIAAVEGAAAWLEAAKIKGIRVVRVETPQGSDRAIKEDPDAPPIWARFYEVGTNRPIFIGRDTVIHDKFSDIERERRRGYAYYGYWPEDLLSKEYPAWAEKWHLKPGG